MDTKNPDSGFSRYSRNNGTHKYGFSTNFGNANNTRTANLGNRKPKPR